MVISCDESKEYPLKVVGSISIPLEDFYSFESAINRLRVEKRVLGEIKWCNIKDEGNYFDFYLDMIKILFSYPKVRFHSNSYKSDQYRASYALIRSISWKMTQIKANNELKILFDENDKVGFKEVKKTKERFCKDHTFYHKIFFCEQINSCTFNIMQATDILTGAIAHQLNKKPNAVKNLFIERIQKEIDGGELITLSSNTLWNYNSKKIQHYNLA